MIDKLIDFVFGVKHLDSIINTSLLNEYRGYRRRFRWALTLLLFLLYGYVISDPVLMNELTYSVQTDPVLIEVWRTDRTIILGALITMLPVTAWNAIGLFKFIRKNDL